MFSDKFIWGVASSAYQIEGRDEADGAGACIWDAYCEQGKAGDGADARTTCDHMHHYKEDFALMRQMGVKHYRFSISWSRLLPEGTGRVNEQAVAMYRDMIIEMKKMASRPISRCFTGSIPRSCRIRAAG